MFNYWTVSLEGYIPNNNCTRGSIIESIKNKLNLLSMMHGLDDMEPTINNLSVSIEHAAIGDNINIKHNVLTYILT